jgi:hypothetical protein
MKSNGCVVEALEGRQFLSAAPVGVASMLVFQGNAVTSAGGIADHLIMTVQKNGSGYTDEVFITTPQMKTTMLSLSMNPVKNFSYVKANAAGISLFGTMNASDTVITGTWTQTTGKVTTGGKYTLDLVPGPLASAPTTGTVTTYTGMEVNSQGKTDPINITVWDNDGVLTGSVDVHNYEDQLVAMPFSISSSGQISFEFSLEDQTAVVVGTLSGKEITGSFIAIGTNGAISYGTMSASEVIQAL